MSTPSRPAFYIPPRESVTGETDPAGRWSSQFPDMMGFRQQGGGAVPADYVWRTNPKQWQEELTESTLAERIQRRTTRLPAAASLPAGEKK